MILYSHVTSFLYHSKMLRQRQKIVDRQQPSNDVSARELLNQKETVPPDQTALSFAGLGFRKSNLRILGSSLTSLSSERGKGEREISDAKRALDAIKERRKGQYKLKTIGLKELKECPTFAGARNAMTEDFQFRHNPLDTRTASKETLKRKLQHHKDEARLDRASLKTVQEGDSDVDVDDNEGEEQRRPTDYFRSSKRDKEDLYQYLGITEKEQFEPFHDDDEEQPDCLDADDDAQREHARNVSTLKRQRASLDLNAETAFEDIYDAHAPPRKKNKLYYIKPPGQQPPPNELGDPDCEEKEHDDIMSKLKHISPQSYPDYGDETDPTLKRKHYEEKQATSEKTELAAQLAADAKREAALKRFERTLILAPLKKTVRSLIFLIRTRRLAASRQTVYEEVE